MEYKDTSYSLRMKFREQSKMIDCWQPPCPRTLTNLKENLEFMTARAVSQVSFLKKKRDHNWRYQLVNKNLKSQIQHRHMVAGRDLFHSMPQQPPEFCWAFLCVCLIDWLFRGQWGLNSASNLWGWCSYCLSHAASPSFFKIFFCLDVSCLQLPQDSP
jgi:hypothetical protein